METKRQRKDRLQSLVKSLNSLNERVTKAMRESTTLSDQDWEALLTLSQSKDLATQIAFLEAAIDEADAALTEVWIELARTSYHDFYEFMNREDGFVMSPHQRIIGDVLEAALRKEIMRFAISMPPGHCKSTHSSHHFPAYYFGHNPKKNFLQAGHSQDFAANELGNRVRAIIDSEDYRLVFPDIKLRSDMRAKDYWGLTNMKGKYVAKGAGQGIAGFRGHFGMVDDPYKSRADAESPTIRDRVFRWFTDDFSTRLLPGSPMGIVMTRWHSDDIVGRIERREQEEERDRQETLLASEKSSTPVYESLSDEQAAEIHAEIAETLSKTGENTHRFTFIQMPAINDNPDDILGREIGEPLWPELFDLDALENLRADMTTSSWNSLYQQRPMDVEGGAVTSEWFQRYERPPSRGENDTENEVRRCTVSVDTANTAKERSNYTVITVWYEDFNRKHYLIDVIRKQMEFPEMKTEVARVCRRYNADALLIEAKGNGLSYLQLHRDGGAPAPLIAIEVGQASKEFRFDEITPMFQAGLVHLPVRAPWLADYEAELIAFPYGKNDDQVDSTSQYLKWAKMGQRRGTKKLHGMGVAR